MKIHKITIEVKSGKQEFKVPIDVHIHCVQNQASNICLWYSFSEVVDEKIPLFVWVEATGLSFELNGSYVGTVQIDQFVWHVYARFGNRFM